MDAVNRKLSMGLMIEAARHSVGRQFILITPQDMGNVSLGPDIRVHRYSPLRSELNLECVILNVDRQCWIDAFWICVRLIHNTILVIDFNQLSEIDA